MNESAGDGSHSNKRKSVDKLSGASRRKLAKEASLKIDARKCLKLTSFMAKIPTIQSSLEVHAENEAVSEDLHPATRCSTPPPDATETNRPPSSGLEHNEEINPIEFEAVEEEKVVGDAIQEPLLPKSGFPTNPGIYSKRSLSTRMIRKL